MFVCVLQRYILRAWHRIGGNSCKIAQLLTQYPAHVTDKINDARIKGLPLEAKVLGLTAALVVVKLTGDNYSARQSFSGIGGEVTLAVDLRVGASWASVCVCQKPNITRLPCEHMAAAGIALCISWTSCIDQMFTVKGLQDLYRLVGNCVPASTYELTMDDLQPPLWYSEVNTYSEEFIARATFRRYAGHGRLLSVGEPERQALALFMRRKNKQQKKRAQEDASRPTPDHQQEQTGPERAKQPRVMKCSHCGDPGHNKKTCKNPQKQK
jgi:hypothetical protein